MTLIKNFFKYKSNNLEQEHIYADAVFSLIFDLKYSTAIIKCLEKIT